METGDWRTQLQADFREKIVNEILVRHLSLPGLEGLEEWEIVAKFEEASYMAATSKSDYLRLVSQIMLAMEKRSEIRMANSLKSKAASTSCNTQDPEPPNSQANRTTTMANSVEHGEALQAIRYKRGSLELLDQRKLPLQTLYLSIRGSEDGWVAIRDMVVRGAPAIAIAAALSLAVEVSNLGGFAGSSSDAASFLVSKLEYLVSSRPTAVNLSDAATKLKQVIQKAAVSASEAHPVFQAYIEAAEVMLEDDIASNKAIGSFGASFIQNQQPDDKKISILTHCNTGSLATAGYGTALGVIRAVHEGGFLERAYCTETRPFNQGSRLTAFELVHDKIPATLIADSAAAALMKAGRVNAIIVGADRVAANGDTANKIGTYSLALSAKHHGIPFYVAAPLTSIDLSTSSGQEIVIEERSAKELLNAGGGMGEQVAASGISVWNPAFDVTPADVISGIVTEKGVITKDGTDYFDIKSFVQRVAGNP